MGFQDAGFNIVAGFDNWEPAVNVYKNNFAHPIHHLDIKAPEVVDLVMAYEPQIIIGGPPCQDFSSAGKRDESLGRADLTITFAEIVSSVKPNWFVMENVDRIQKSYVLKIAKDIFRKAQYNFTETVLLASRCGAPQNRKRYFLIGELNGQDDAILPYFEKNMSNERMTIYDYLGDSLGIECYYRHPRTYQRRAIFSIYEPSPTIRGVNRPIPSTYKQHPGDACSISHEVRPLTTIERSYIQTFPTSFQFEGSKTKLEQMIGNAVPVKQADFVANCILEYIADKNNNDIIKSNELKQLPLI